MKKIILLLTFLLLISGCAIKNIDDEDINTVIDNALKEENRDFIEIYSGYKFKIPQGMKTVGKSDYNIKLMYNEDYYYLYIDIISKYRNKEIKYEENSNSYLSKTINYKDKIGYVEINKIEDNKYHVRAEYNYAKIETIITEEKIKTSTYNIIKILSSIEYNDLIIETLIGENALTYEEEEFNFFDSTREEGFFMDYVDEYNEYESDVKDEDVIS
jgi:hypothetical protein